MGYNHGLEEKKFKMEWNKLREQYRAAGMSEEAINEMEAFDRHCMDRDRKFYEHTTPIDFRKEDGTDQDNASKSSRRQFGDRLQVEARITDPDRRFAWIDELDDEELVKAVKSLSVEEVELLTMIAYEGYTHKELAQKLGKGRSSVTEKIGRIAKKLKNF